jgi:hypothetical protein
MFVLGSRFHFLNALERRFEIGADLGREKVSGHESLHGPLLFTTNGNDDSRGATNSDDDDDGDSTCSDDGDGDNTRSKPANENCSR